MEISEHITALERDGDLLAVAAERAGLGATVPSCPPWQVRDLLRHIGYVHRWAAGYLAEQRTQPLPNEPSESEVLSSGPPDAELVGWFRAGHAALVRTLRTADPAVACWTVVPGPSPLASWARRQAHETAIHRVDAELAAGAVTPFPADFAADGIDELIMGFLGRDRSELRPGQREGQRLTLQVLATGPSGGGAWLVELTADGSLAARVARGTAPAECTLAGPAAALYQLLWNRADLDSPGVTVNGDQRVLQAWRNGARVRWD
jgi:uncharacterized protein (TIGR03083 family)